MKEKWELVMRADAEVTSMLRAIEERQKELTSKQARATELRQQIDALRRQIVDVSQRPVFVWRSILSSAPI